MWTATVQGGPRSALADQWRRCPSHCSRVACLRGADLRDVRKRRMADRVDTLTRSRIMRAVRSAGTGPELEVRRALFACGFRYRLHVADLPGKPDLVLPRHRAVVFVHGCFWHGHGCSRHPRAKSGTQDWVSKIARNQERDRAAEAELARRGWRVLVIWECAVRRRVPPFRASAALSLVVSWLRGGAAYATLGEDGMSEAR